MTWRVGQATVSCPRCGQPVTVPVDAQSVSIEPQHGNVDGKIKTIGFHIRVRLDEEGRASGHKCADLLDPIDRFLTSGHLDDPVALPP